MAAKPTLEEQMRQLSREFHAIIDPPLVRLLGWIDRQLRRSPRLYRWLSR